ncbi:MAG: methyl-accepting chemotaxis protein [Microcoleaceae cyanobacterium]
MLANLRFRDRLLVGYVVPVLFCLGLTSLVYNNATKALSTFQEVERVQKVILGVHNMERGAHGMVASYRGYLILQDNQSLTEYQLFYKQTKEFYQILQPLIIRADQRQRLDQMLERVESHYAMVNRGVELLKEKKRPEAISLWQSDGQRFANQFMDVSKKFTNIEESFLTNQTLETEKNWQSLITVLAIGCILLVVISILVAFTITLVVSSRINQVVNVIASSTNEIAATIEQQERTANQQASAVNETTTTMDELGASSQVAAEQAESAANGAKQVLSLAEGGTKAVDSTLAGMANLRNKVGVIAQQIMRLSEQTNQIGNISEVVSDLANQTNMLALNAAVEAVRAGERGKGFAVVATEIRKLADESRKSADKINNLVGDIQTAISATVMATEEGTKTVENGVNIAEKTADAFNGVAESVNNVVVNNQRISLNVKQQAIAIQQVVEAMNGLNVAAKNNAAGLSQTKIGTQKLNEAAIELQSII